MTQVEKEAPSANTPGRSRMQLVGERQAPDRQTPSPIQYPTQPLLPKTGTTPPAQPLEHLKQEYIERSAWKQGVLGALNVAVAILAARLVVLVAVIGGIGLTWSALVIPDPVRLGALGIYCVAIVIPTIWLAGRG